MGGQLDELTRLLGSGHPKEAAQLARAALDELEDLPGLQLLRALELVATALWSAGRDDEAREVYAAMVAIPDIGGDYDDQIRVVTAEMMLARLAVTPGDTVGERLHLERAAQRLSGAEPPDPGAQSVSFLREIGLTGQLAGLQLLRGEPAAARGSLHRVLAAAAAASGQDPPGDSLPVAAYNMAALLYAYHEEDTAALLLHRLAQHRLGVHDLEGAAAAYRKLGDLIAKAGDGPAAWSAYRDGVDALDVGRERREIALAQAELINHAAWSVDKLGEYGTAAAGYQKALEIRERWFEPGDYDLILSRYNVAEIARRNGRNDFAEAELKDVIDALASGSSAALLRLALKNRAQALLSLGRAAEAEQSISVALEMGTVPAKTRGIMLSIRGAARAAQGPPRGISAELAQLAEVAAEEQGEGSLEHLTLLVELARTLPSPELPEVEALLRRVISGLDADGRFDARVLVSRAYRGLADVCQARGDFAAAFAAMAAAVPMSEELRAEQWRVRSAFTGGVSDPWDLFQELVLLVARHLPDRLDARQLAFRCAISGKRRQAETLASQQVLGLQGRSEILDLHGLAAAMRRSVAWSDGDSAADTVRLTSLEADLARAVPRQVLQEIDQRSTAERVAAAMPAGFVLVEYVRCQPADGTPTHYVAFVLPAGQAERIAIIDLGASDPIDGAVQALRAVIDQGTGDDGWQAQARVLARRIWDPVATWALDRAVGRLPGDAKVLVAPDGPLCAVPFDALISADGRPLVATTAITLLATGRDADRMDVRANWRTNAPVVIAPTDFGDPEGPFKSLLGALEEGYAVADLLDVVPFTGEEATRDRLLALESPEILHLATHGYYIPSVGPGSPAAHITAAAAEHPLISSGVALAGANNTTASQPGVVSALDILGLQFAGTDLVVLSACESGLGPLDAAEGLLGLARSFVLAGARSVVWTLWPIDDTASASLIQDVYRRMMTESHRTDALRAAKRAVYAMHPERVDVWAGFVLQGDPGALLRFRSVFVPLQQIYQDQPHVRDGVAYVDTRGRPVAAQQVDIGSGRKITTGVINVRNLELGVAEDAYNKGNAYFMAKRYAEARQCYEKGLSSAEHLAVGREIKARLHAQLAVLAGLAGDFVSSREHGLTALGLFEGMDGTETSISRVLDYLGAAEVNLGEQTAGIGRLERALKIKRSLFLPDDLQIKFTEDALNALRQADS